MRILREPDFFLQPPLFLVEVYSEHDDQNHKQQNHNDHNYVGTTAIIVGGRGRFARFPGAGLPFLGVVPSLPASIQKAMSTFTPVFIDAVESEVGLRVARYFPSE